MGKYENIKKEISIYGYSHKHKISYDLKHKLLKEGYKIKRILCYDEFGFMDMAFKITR